MFCYQVVLACRSVSSFEYVLFQNFSLCLKQCAVVQKVVSCLVSMLADARCIFQQLKALEVRPRFPVPCHHRRNGRGHVSFYVQPVLSGGKVLFCCTCLETFFPIALPISFGFFLYFVIQCTLRNSVECDIGVLNSCSFLSQSVGHFISVDPFV